MAKAHTLVDNFNDNAIDAAKWNGYGTPGPVAERIREINGRLELRPANGTTGYSGVESQVLYDLAGSQISVELIRPLSSAHPAVETLMRASLNGDNKVEIGVSAGLLFALYVTAGAYNYFAEALYDPALHRWLRIRETDGTVFWEVSADGCEWKVLGSRPAPFSMYGLQIHLLAGNYEAQAGLGTAIFDHFNVGETSRSRRVDERRLSARDVRVEAAERASRRTGMEHVNNNDEVNFPMRPLVGNFSKSLKHDALGDPDPASYATLLRALESRDPQDFEEIQLASATALELTNPQSGLTFDVEGPDPQEITQPPAPRFDSEVTAHEMGELYWMAVARDVPFISYASEAAVASSIIQRTINSLNAEFPRFGGTVPVTAQNLFRGVYRGEQMGPYVSQFLVKGNTDPRRPDGLGRDANEGFISYGAQTIDQRQLCATPGVDYLATFATWLEAQNGVDKRGQDWFDPVKRFIRTLRDGATYVHFDQVINAFYNAAWVLMSEPTGNQLAFVAGTTGRPQVDLEFTKNRGNPYDPPGTAMDSRTQVGFGTFGPIHIVQVLSEVLGRAIRAVWWQKWGVHRRLRPEEYGGRVHNQVTGARTYPLNTSITTSLASGGLAPYFGQAGEEFPSSYLLPQAYPEGAPTHPAYGAGHATGSGAMITMLKAFFDDTAAIENPLQAAADGLSLVAYTGADAAQPTVGGELNKLAGNIAIFRNAAGVHWRSDYTESVLFGESIAVRMLQEMSLGFNEDDAFFELTRLDGMRIRIADGRVTAV